MTNKTKEAIAALNKAKNAKKETSKPLNYHSIKKNFFTLKFQCYVSLSLSMMVLAIRVYSNELNFISTLSISSVVLPFLYLSFFIGQFNLIKKNKRQFIINYFIITLIFYSVIFTYLFINTGLNKIIDKPTFSELTLE